MIKHEGIAVTVKEIGNEEYIGYINVIEPFQNLYCEISCDKKRLQQDLELKATQLYGQFTQIREISVQKRERSV